MIEIGLQESLEFTASSKLHEESSLTIPERDPEWMPLSITQVISEIDAAALIQSIDSNSESSFPLRSSPILSQIASDAYPESTEDDLYIRNLWLSYLDEAIVYGISIGMDAKELAIWVNALSSTHVHFMSNQNTENSLPELAFDIFKRCWMTATYLGESGKLQKSGPLSRQKCEMTIRYFCQGYAQQARLIRYVYSHSRAIQLRQDSQEAIYPKDEPFPPLIKGLILEEWEEKQRQEAAAELEAVQQAEALARGIILKPQKPTVNLQISPLDVPAPTIFPETLFTTDRLSKIALLQNINLANEITHVPVPPPSSLNSHSMSGKPQPPPPEPVPLTERDIGMIKFTEILKETVKENTTAVAQYLKLKMEHQVEMINGKFVELEDALGKKKKPEVVTAPKKKASPTKK